MWDVVLVLSIFGCLLFGAFVFLVIGFFVGVACAYETYKKEAIKRGLGEYKSGVFAWKDASCLKDLSK